MCSAGLRQVNLSVVSVESLLSSEDAETGRDFGTGTPIRDRAEGENEYNAPGRNSLDHEGHEARPPRFTCRGRWAHEERPGGGNSRGTGTPAGGTTVSAKSAMAAVSAGYGAPAEQTACPGRIQKTNDVHSQVSVLPCRGCLPLSAKSAMGSCVRTPQGSNKTKPVSEPGFTK